MRKSLRVAVISHGHPDFSVGGAEVAAYNLFKGYRENPRVEEAVFLARCSRGPHPSGTITLRREGEYLWDQAMHDWDCFRGLDRKEALRRFSDWLQSVRPDVVHAHHYAHMGLEIFRLIKRVCPDAKLFVTLHEYMAICKHNGQMVRPGGNRLCSSESIDDCHRCYPSISRESFWLRKRFIMRHFDAVDGFFSPSEFLRQRYVDWGISPDRIVVIENGQEMREPVPHRPLTSGEYRNRFGFFGQLTQYKGVDVFLQGVEIAAKESETPIRVEIHGANLEGQSQEFQERIGKLREKLERKRILQWVGPYEPDELPQRMANIDWVVVPSIWWENSPMVIQEAFHHRRPVICSGIGGMAEKVTPGRSGLHVEKGNIFEWAATIRRAAGDVLLWDSLEKEISPPASYDEVADLHLANFIGKNKVCSSLGKVFVSVGGD
ncbi:MAG: glycosyltransferase family 4 protein [Nisaea sp.]|uniref:glycosyltransferase family 4 protein n=1 Tax=Nisaea sp. TaxID=2024842 RepID=UPI001B0A746F|nr:glycosyltransferase family 4 protein [Nisaea sp.]MBO6560812.1 glycosyltransferase family 4 protein [Nisaea sp.]